MYKIPKIKGSSNRLIRTGMAYAYITSTTDSDTWTLSKLSVNNSNSLPGNTLSPLYQSGPDEVCIRCNNSVILGVFNSNDFDNMKSINLI